MTGETRMVAIPCSPRTWLYLGLPVDRQLTEAEWAQMHAVLDALRPGLVEQPEPVLATTADGRTR